MILVKKVTKSIGGEVVENKVEIYEKDGAYEWYQAQFDVKDIPGIIKALSEIINEIK